MPTTTEKAPAKAGNTVSLAELEQQVDTAERQAVLAAFTKLKGRKEAGELRVAVRADRASGVTQIVYMGIHEQQNLEPLRKLYAQLLQRRNGAPLTFGRT